jgi:hypothetical protein
VTPRHRLDEERISSIIEMIERAVATGVPFGWVSADEAYGDNGPLRGWLEREGIAYVLAVARDHRVRAGAGRTIRADTLAARIPPAGGSGSRAGPAVRATGSMTVDTPTPAAGAGC